MVFSIATIRVAGNMALFESGMLNGLYLIAMPGIAAVSPFVVEMWLESLPSQVGHRLLYHSNNMCSSLFMGGRADRELFRRMAERIPFIGYPAARKVHSVHTNTDDLPCCTTANYLRGSSSPQTASHSS